jgi:hypothetical protein
MIAQSLAVLVGLWLMAAPAVLNYAEPASTVDRIVGPLAATVGAVAFTQAMRPVRLWNLPLGLWLVGAPLLLGYEGRSSLNSFLAGLALIVLSRIRGRITRRFGGGWASLVRAQEVVPAPKR